MLLEQKRLHVGIATVRYYVSVEEKFALQPSIFQCKCKRKIYVIFENRVKKGEEIASYNGGESCLAAK